MHTLVSKYKPCSDAIKLEHTDLPKESSCPPSDSHRLLYVDVLMGDGLDQNDRKTMFVHSHLRWHKMWKQNLDYAHITAGVDLFAFATILKF